jgi:hypothetical protein
MDDELKHILCDIDRLFDYLVDCNYKRIGDIVDNYYLIKNDPYMDDLDYKYELEMAKEEWLYQINELSAYTRALDHKLNESYKAILENRDNGDMI